MITSRRSVIALAVALVLSLGLNLFLFGVLAGKISKRPDAQTIGRGDGRMRPLAELSAEDQAVIRETMASVRTTAEPLIRELPKIKREIHMSLVADPFDPARFRTAMTQMTTQQGKLREVAADAIATAAPRLTPGARTSFARVLMMLTSLADDQRRGPNGRPGEMMRQRLQDRWQDRPHPIPAEPAAPAPAETRSPADSPKPAETP